MFENLKGMMGESYHDGITAEEVNNFFAGKSFADLSTGQYVDKNKYDREIQTLNSIDQFINSHKRFVRDIISFLGLNDEKYMKKVYKIFNIIVSLPTLVNKYVISNKENEKEMEDLYMEIVNGMGKYTKNENKIKDMIDSMKEKLALLIR